MENIENERGKRKKLNEPWFSKTSVLFFPLYMGFSTVNLINEMSLNVSPFDIFFISTSPFHVLATNISSRFLLTCQNDR